MCTICGLLTIREPSVTSVMVHVVGVLSKILCLYVFTLQCIWSKFVSSLHADNLFRPLRCIWSSVHYVIMFCSLHGVTVLLTLSLKCGQNVNRRHSNYNQTFNRLDVRPIPCLTCLVSKRLYCNYHYRS